MKIINTKARYDYELGERWECGVVLTGAEVKSVKLGQADMGGAFCKIQRSKFKNQNEVFVNNLKIFAYKHADNTRYVPDRPKKLLLHQREILELASKMKATGRLLIPTAMYTKSDRVKIEVALARGKRKYEKREVEKRRDWERKMRQNVV